MPRDRSKLRGPVPLRAVVHLRHAGDLHVAGPRSAARESSMVPAASESAMCCTEQASCHPARPMSELISLAADPACISFAEAGSGKANRASEASCKSSGTPGPTAWFGSTPPLGDGLSRRHNSLQMVLYSRLATLHDLWRGWL